VRIGAAWGALGQAGFDGHALVCVTMDVTSLITSFAI
jgi:hypothetical protein